MQGTYLLAILLIFAFAVEPELSARILVTAGLKIQIFYINYRMKFMAWQMWRRICKMSEEHGFPHPGPFQYVDLWDREPGS